MFRLLSIFSISVLLLGLAISTPIEVSAQKVIEAQLSPNCVTALSSKITLFTSLIDLINPQANLPFTPTVCAVNTKGQTTAIPVKYLPFVLLRVYKFIISLALYGFGFSMVILGVMMQAEILQGDLNYWSKIQKGFSRSITGLFTVLFAYYIVQIILFIFNIENILTEVIIK
jgi:hypothetical protein